MEAPKHPPLLTSIAAAAVLFPLCYLQQQLLLLQVVVVVLLLALLLLVLTENLVHALHEPVHLPLLKLMVAVVVDVVVAGAQRICGVEVFLCLAWLLLCLFEMPIVSLQSPLLCMPVVVVVVVVRAERVLMQLVILLLGVGDGLP